MCGHMGGLNVRSYGGSQYVVIWEVSMCGHMKVVPRQWQLHRRPTQGDQKHIIRIEFSDFWGSQCVVIWGVSICGHRGGFKVWSYGGYKHQRNNFAGFLLSC